MRLDYYTKDDKAKTSKEAAERLANIEHLTFRSDKQVVSFGNHQRGRSVFTRTIDLTFAMIRKYAPPIHWVGALISAVTLFLYIRLVALTARLRTMGSTQWPDIRAGSVVALWHRDAPSLLTAFALRRPQIPCWIMIASDSRGDCLALLCRLLRFQVVRGGSDIHGWEALAELSKPLLDGAAVIITADGGGPARVAKVGAVALASAASVPLTPLAVNCYPAVEERNKWDSARNPLPLSSILVSLGPSRVFDSLLNVQEIEKARSWLEETLNRMSEEAESNLRR